MKNKILVEIEKDKILLYLSNRKGKENSYIKYEFAHIKKPFIDGGIMQNQDLWRILRLYVTEKTDDDFAEIFPFSLTTGGEWECAIKISNTPDFHGGFHGYEYYDDVHLLADGKKINIEQNDTFWCNKVVFYQKSRIIRQGTQDDIIALHTKEYFFEDGNLDLEQTITWVAKEKVDRAYLCMLPIIRTYGKGEELIQITDTLTVDGYPDSYDIKNVGHRTPFSCGTENYNDVNKIIISGKESGIAAEVSFKKEAAKGSYFEVQNTPPFNKIYFSFVGANGVYETCEGEKWSQRNHYEIYKK